MPFTQLRKNPYFYIWYDGIYFVLCLLLLIAAMRLAGHERLVATWDWRLIAVLLPVACYAQVLASVFIHNCTHTNFPRAINRIVGELCGIVVLTRFASWEVIHQRHHRYPDDVEKDPHPVVSSYWRFLGKTIVGVEHHLQQIYFSLYGDTPETRRFEKGRAYGSYATNLLLLFTWYSFLGPIAFFTIFVPSSIVGFFHLLHFNWSTHNASSTAQDYKPVNLDHGFYWVGNRVWFGIYMHANHHKRTNLFNPAVWQAASPVLAAAAQPARVELASQRTR